MTLMDTPHTCQRSSQNLIISIVAMSLEKLDSATTSPRENSNFVGFLTHYFLSYGDGDYFIKLKDFSFGFVYSFSCGSVRPSLLKLY